MEPHGGVNHAIKQRRLDRDWVNLTQSRSNVIEVLPPSAIGKPLEIWFQDEARVGQKGWISYQWAPIGSRPLAVRDNRHDSVYLFGAICPDRAVGAAIIMPAANTDAMNEHLKEISHAGAARCAGSSDLRRRRMASAKQDVGRPVQRHTDAPSALFTGTQFDGKCVALSPRE